MRSNEADETVLVNLSSATNASIDDSQATLTITNDDPVPSITIANASITEGNSGTKTVTVTLTLSAASGRTVTRELRDGQWNGLGGQRLRRQVGHRDICRRHDDRLDYGDDQRGHHVASPTRHSWST